jgi:hypothetical protein
MVVIEFKSAKAERSGCDKVSVALFNGAITPVCVAILECQIDGAWALERELVSVLRHSENGK